MLPSSDTSLTDTCQTQVVAQKSVLLEQLANEVRRNGVLVKRNAELYESLQVRQDQTEIFPSIAGYSPICPTAPKTSSAKQWHDN